MTIDGRVGFFPRGETPEGIFALCKMTLDTASGRVVDGDPLTPDMTRPEVAPSLLPGSDSYLTKRFTDVVVLGSAYARRPTASMRATVTVGRFAKSVEVIGDRALRWEGRTPVFEAPQPFTEMPLGLERAYGGIDLRVPVDERFDPTIADHPGLYPRNPYGTGYLVSPDPVEGVALPNVEDPDDLLTPERLVVGDPARWWHHPIPATLGYLPPNVFNRYVYTGAEAWFPPPTDARLPEIRRGDLPPRYRALAEQGLHPDFFQEASGGLRLAVTPGTPITARGMHPEGKTVRFVVPPVPEITVMLDGREQRLAPMLSKVELHPARERAVLTWAAWTERMHRVYVPRVHAEIPLAARIAGRTVAYDTPPTLRSVVAAAGEAQAPRPRPPRA